MTLSVQLALLILLGQIMATKYMVVFSRLCITEALGSFKQTEAGVNVVCEHAWKPIGGTDISTDLLRKIIFWGILCVRREERKDSVSICKYTAH